MMTSADVPVVNDFRIEPIVDDWILTLSLGASLLGVGLMLIRSHFRKWKTQQNDSSLDNADRVHLHTRYRRRMQASGLIAVLGVVIPAGDLLIPWKNVPLLFAPFWGVVLLAALWVILLGLADIVATATHSRAALNRVREKRRKLERQIAEIQRRTSNGRNEPAE